MTQTEHALRCGLSFAYFGMIKKKYPERYKWLLELGNGSLSRGYMIARDNYQDMKDKLAKINIETGKSKSPNKIKLLDIVMEVCKFKHRASATQFLNGCYVMDTYMYMDTYMQMEEILRRWYECKCRC